MLAPKTGRMRGGMLLAVVSSCVLFVCAMPVEAQRGRGGGGPGRPPPAQPPRGDQPTGSEQGRLIKFKPAKDGSEDEDLPACRRAFRTVQPTPTPSCYEAPRSLG